MDTIFTVTNSDLAKFDARGSVDIFRELLWAEARHVGVPVSKVHVSSWINVPDGGVDAAVEATENLVRANLIKAGFTTYQIKTGTSFEPWQHAQIANELFGKGKPLDLEHLAPRVRDCLNKDGTYVLVCFGQDPTQEQLNKAHENLRNALKGCRYENPKVEIWGQNNLLGFIKPFPSLALRINGVITLRFKHTEVGANSATCRQI
jgi:hypothetical protein